MAYEEKTDLGQPYEHDFASHVAVGDTTDAEALGTLKNEASNNDPLKQYATHLDPHDSDSLSPAHREYLMQRHGTLSLEPLPGYGDADPYNWPQWKKVTNLLLVAFHACMSTFNAAAIIPAYENIAVAFNVTIPEASYLTSLQIAILGIAPLFWKPLSARWGRRPIWFLSTFCAMICNIGCAVAPSYATMAVCRALVAFFISPAAAIGSAVVTETFFKTERARYMGIWTLMVTCGVPLGSFIFGFVAYHIGWRWIFWILAIIHGVQFLLYIPFGPETRYLRKGVDHEASSFKLQYMSFRRIDPTPLTAYEFVQPLKYFGRPSVFIPALAYAVVFLLASVLITVEIPQLFAMKFGFNPQQLSLQFIAIIVGSVIGEQLGGVLSDFWMNRRAKQIHGRPAPEYRLWLSYSGFVLTIIGLVVFLVRTEQATTWNVTPLIGAGIAAAGNQIITTVMITYAVDCHHHQESGSIGVFITFVRQILGFIGPFWFPYMFTNVGLDGSSGIGVGLVVVFSVIPVLALQFLGEKWRNKRLARVA